MQRKPSLLRLRTWLIVVLSTALVLPTLIWGLVYTVGLGSLSRGIILENLKQRGESHAGSLARQLYLPWRHVSYLATTLDIEDRDSLGNLLTHLVGSDERYLWLGVARTDGRLLAASSGHLKDADMSGRDWFEAGLRGPFAGEPHLDAALAELLPRRSDGYAFFNYAAPIHDDSGRVVGVLGAHFDWNQIKSSLARFSGNRMETLLINRSGKVLIGPEGLGAQGLPVGNSIAQAQSEPSLRLSTWRDGLTYVSVTVPGFAYADMPSPGFSLIVREKAAQAFQPMRLLIRYFWRAVALGAAMVLPVIVALSWWVAAPISRLAQFADDVANSRAVPPPEHHSYRESEQLSAALTRLQCRMGAQDAHQHDRPEIQAMGSFRNDRSPPQCTALL